MATLLKENKVVSPQTCKKIITNPILSKVYVTVNRKKAKYPQISTELRQKLTRKYRSDISKLEDLIGEDLSLWKEA